VKVDFCRHFNKTWYASGQPRASVSWWLGNQLLDTTHDAESSSTNVSINQLFLPSVGRSLWGQRLGCHARNSNLTAPVVKDVALLIYCESIKKAPYFSIPEIGADL
jgi:hypothetical protein